MSQVSEPSALGPAADSDPQPTADPPAAARRGFSLPRSAYPVAAVVSLAFAWLILSTSLQPLVPPLGRPPTSTFVIEGVDTTLAELADDSSAPVDHVGATGAVFQLKGHLVIEPTGRLTIQQEALYIGETPANQSLRIDVNGTLIIRDSLLLETDAVNTTFAGITVHPRGQLIIERSILRGGDPTVHIMDPHAQLAMRVNITNSQIDSSGTGLLIDDVQNGAWLEHDHASSFSLTDDLVANGTAHGVADPSTRTVIWTLDDTLLTNTDGLDLDESIPTGTDPGLHVLHSTMHTPGNATDVLATGATLVLIDDSEATGTLSSHRDGTNQSWNWSGDGLEGYGWIQWQRRAPVDLVDAWNISVNDRSGPAGVVREHTTTARHLASVAWDPSDQDRTTPQALVIGEGDDLWLGLWSGSEHRIHPLGSDAWAPTVLTGDPYGGASDRAWLLSWSEEERVRSGWLSNGSQAPGSALPFGTATGIGLCQPNATAPNLYRWLPNGTADGLSWNGSAWEADNATFDFTSVPWFKPEGALSCVDLAGDNVSDVIIHHEPASDMLTRLDLTWNDSSRTWAVSGHQNVSWNASGPASAVIARVDSGVLEVARVPLGLDLTARTSWTAWPATGDLSHITLSDIASNGTGVPRAGGVPGLPVGPGGQNSSGHLHLDEGDLHGDWVLEDAESGEIVDGLSAAAAWRVDLSLASCDLDGDGDRDLLEFSSDGHWSRWVRTVQAGNLSTVPTTGDWAQSATGSLTLPGRVEDVSTVACLDADSDAPMRLVIVDSEGDALVLVPPAVSLTPGESDTTDLFDLDAWTALDPGALLIPVGAPRRGWMGARLAYQGGTTVSVPALQHITSVASIPRWRPSNGSFVADINLTGPAHAGATIALHVGGLTASQSVWLDAGGSWNGTLTTADLSVGRHDATLSLPDPPLGTRLSVATLRAITLNSWTVLTAHASVSDVALDVSSGPGLHVDGAAVVATGIRLAGNSTSSQPALLVEAGDLDLSQLTIDDHSDAGISLDSSSLTLVGFRGQGLASAVLEADDSRIDASSWEIVNQSSAAGAAMVVSGGTFDLELMRTENVSMVLELTDGDIAWSNVTLDTTARWGALSGSAADITASIVDLTADGEFAVSDVGLTMSGTNEVRLERWNVSVINGTEALIEVLGGSLMVSNSTIQHDATVIVTQNASVADVRESYLGGGDSTPVLSAQDTSQVQLLGVTLTGGDPEAADTAIVEARTRATFVPWRHDLPGTTATMTISAPGGATLATGPVAVTSDPGDSIELTQYAGVHPVQWDLPGFLLELWQLNGDGTSTPRTGPIDRMPQVEVSWSYDGETSEFLVPILSARPIRVQLTGDADHDALEDVNETQDGSKGLHAATWPLIHDLVAVDQESIHATGDGNLTLAPTSADGTHRLWMRWYAADVSADCLVINVSEHGGGETHKGMCVPVGETPEWVPGEEIVLDDGARAVSLSLSVPDGGVVIIDEAWLVAGAEVPTSAWLADLDRDGLVDGLEEPSVGALLPVAPNASWGGPSSAVSPHRDSPWGWRSHLNSSETYVIPPNQALTSSEVWIRGAVPSTAAFTGSVFGGPSAAITTTVTEGWQRLEWSAGGPVSLPSGEDLVLTATADAISIDASWQRIAYAGSWSASAPAAATTHHDLDVGTWSPHSVLRGSSSSILQQQWVLDSQDVPAVDPLTGWTVVVNVTCAVYTYEALDEAALWIRSASVCDSTRPFAADAEDGTVAYLAYNLTSGAIELVIEPVHPNSSARQHSEYLGGTFIAADPADFDIQMANGRVLVRLQDEWWVFQWHRGAWESWQLGQGNGATDPVSLYLDDHGIPSVADAEMRACVINDHLFFLIRNNVSGEGIWDLVSSLLSGIEVETPSDATDRTVSPSMTVPTRYGIVHSYPYGKDAYLEPQVVCMYGEVAVALQVPPPPEVPPPPKPPPRYIHGWIHDTRTGDSISVQWYETELHLGQAMHTSLVVQRADVATLYDMHDDEGALSLSTSHMISVANPTPFTTQPGAPLVSPWNVIQALGWGYPGPPGVVVPVPALPQSHRGGHDLWYAHANVSEKGTVSRDIELRGPFIDHTVRLSTLVDVLLARQTLYGLDVDTTRGGALALSIETVRDQVPNLVTDADRDALWDGPEGERHAIAQRGQFADATTHLGCTEAMDPPGFSERWLDPSASDGRLQMNEQCRIQEGIRLQWRPGGGPGAALTLPLDVATSGPHRLTLQSSQIVEVQAGLIVSFMEDATGSSVAAGTQLMRPGSPSPNWTDAARFSWLPDLVEVEILDASGMPAEVIDDQVWIDEARLEQMPDGNWSLRLRLDGHLDVHVQTDETHDLRIRWQADGWHDDWFDDLNVTDGPSAIDDIEVVALAPLNAASWGRLGADRLTADADADGLLDGADVAIAGSDVDEDGLSDAVEAALGTSALSRDTDADGVLDPVEVGVSSITNASCVDRAQQWRAASASTRMTHQVQACPGADLAGASTWLHRRALGTLLTLEAVTREDGNSSTWSEPLDLDTDGDGLPDGWIDGWSYVGSLADGGLVEADPASGTASILELASLGAYDEHRWRSGLIRDGLITLYEGEDIDLDGAVDTTYSGEVWMTERRHLALNGTSELDPGDADTDADLLPDGWELLVQAWFVDRTGSQTHQNPGAGGDAQHDRDLAVGDFQALKEGMVTELWRPTMTDTQLVLALPFVLANGSENWTGGDGRIEAFQFMGHNLPDQSMLAIAPGELLDDNMTYAKWWSLDTNQLPGVGTLQFHRPLRVAAGLHEVQLDVPLTGDDLKDALVVIRLPMRAGGYASWNLQLLMTDDYIGAPISRDHATRAIGTSPDANWSISSVTRRLVLMPALTGVVAGDHLSALTEYRLGTLPTRSDTDFAYGIGHRDLVHDGQEVAPGWTNASADLITDADIPIRWVTNATKARLGWRWATHAPESSAWAVANVSNSSQHWWFTWSGSGQVLDSALSATACGEPAALAPFARLDDGAWLGLDVAVDGSEGEPAWLCLMHPATHWEDDGSWAHRKAQGVAFSLTPAAALPAALTAATWNVTGFPRHQLGFAGAPFQRDADGDGLMDGYEGTAAWLDTGAGNLSDWNTSVTGLDGATLPGDAFLDDHDADGIPDAWDMDADDDGVLDGSEVGWLVDLDADGLPGAVDADSDADGAADGDEHLPTSDSDGDGFKLQVNLPGQVVRTVHIGANTLDVDSDNDGLLDGWVDGLRWDVLAVTAVDVRAEDWLNESGPLGLADLGLTSTGLAKWFPPIMPLEEITPLNENETSEVRLAGGPVFSTEGISGATLMIRGAWRLDMTFLNATSPLIHPWEGESADSDGAFDISMGDTDPTRADTDGDGLFDGPTLFIGWDDDVIDDWAGLDENWTWSGSLRDTPLDRADWDRAALIAPDGAALALTLTDREGHAAAWRGAWARAGEVVGPHAHRSFVPPTPWTVDWTTDATTQITCDDVALLHSQQTGSQATRPGWLDLLFNGAETDARTACWDVHLNVTAGNGSGHEWQWLGWSDGTAQDTDGDALDDAAERGLVRIRPEMPDWQEWQGAVTDPVHVSRAWYLSAASPRDDDTDGDGLADGLEVQAGLAPDDPDTDHDGIHDGVEDADGDGVHDPDETSARRVDTDNDGLPDGGRTLWSDTSIAFAEDSRVLLGGSPLSGDWVGEHDGAGSVHLSDALDRDSDDDGASDGDEYLVCRVFCLDHTDWDEVAGLLGSVDGDGDGLWDSGEVRRIVRPSFSKGKVAAQTSGSPWWEPHASSPISNDSDADGLTDGWEPFPFADSEDDGTINVRDDSSVDAGVLDGDLSFVVGLNLSNGSWELTGIEYNATREQVEVTNPIADGEGRMFATPTVVGADELPTNVQDLHQPIYSFADVEFGGMAFDVNLHDARSGTVLVNLTATDAVWALWIPSGRSWLRLRIIDTQLGTDVSWGPGAVATDAETRANSLISNIHVLNTDQDFDGAENDVEIDHGTDIHDRDSDDDGVPDGMDIQLCRITMAQSTQYHSHLVMNINGADRCYDVDGDGLASFADVDSDGDGVRDGIELGRTGPLSDIPDLIADPIPGTDLTATIASGELTWSGPDADPGTWTDPLDVDSDHDGVPDGWLDIDHDLVLDTAGGTDELRPRQRLATPVSSGDQWVLWTDEVDWEDVSGSGAIQTLRGAEDWDADGVRSGHEPDPLDSDGDDDGLPDGPSSAFRQALYDSWVARASAGSPLAAILGSTTWRPRLLEVCAGEDWDGRPGLPPEHQIAENTPLHRVDWDDDELVNLWDSDSDGDGLSDGWECGVTLAVLNDAGLTESRPRVSTQLTRGSDTTHRNWSAHSGGQLITDPWDADSDDDGLSDRAEDADQDGHHGARESHPLLHDSDGDGLLDGTEKGRDTSSLSGHLAWATDTSKHAPRWTSTPTWAGGPTMYTFVPDADTSNNTRAWSTDSDLDGLADNDEDINRNGAHDSDADQSACTWTATLSEQSTIFAGTDPGLYWEASTTCELSPTQTDSDEDGVSEGRELAGWLVKIHTLRTVLEWPSAQDGSLGALSESMRSSSPWLSDTDSDGLSDGLEANYSSDPTRSDTDGDTVIDSDDFGGSDSPVVMEAAAPSIEIPAAGITQRIQLTRLGDSVLLRRSLSATVLVQDSAGIAAARASLGDLPIRVGPGSDVDMVALADCSARQEPGCANSGSILIAYGGTVQQGEAVVSGLRTGIEWTGTLWLEFALSAESAGATLIAVIGDLPDWLAGASSPKIASLSTSLTAADLRSAFGSAQLLVRAEDTNGNSGEAVVSYVNVLQEWILDSSSPYIVGLVLEESPFGQNLANVLSATIETLIETSFRHPSVWSFTDSLDIWKSVAFLQAVMLNRWVDLLETPLGVMRFLPSISVWTSTFNIVVANQLAAISGGLTSSASSKATELLAGWPSMQLGLPTMIKGLLEVPSLAAGHATLMSGALAGDSVSLDSSAQLLTRVVGVMGGAAALATAAGSYPALSSLIEGGVPGCLATTVLGPTAYASIVGQVSPGSAASGCQGLSQSTKAGLQSGTGAYDPPLGYDRSEWKALRLSTLAYSAGLLAPSLLPMIWVIVEALNIGEDGHLANGLTLWNAGLSTEDMIDRMELSWLMTQINDQDDAGYAIFAVTGLASLYQLLGSLGAAILRLSGPAFVAVGVMIVEVIMVAMALIITIQTQQKYAHWATQDGASDLYVAALLMAGFGALIAAVKIIVSLAPAALPEVVTTILGGAVIWWEAVVIVLSLFVWFLTLQTLSASLDALMGVNYIQSIDADWRAQL